MSTGQAVVIFITCIILFFGSINIMLSPYPNLFLLLVFWIIVVIPARILYSYLEKRRSKTEAKQPSIFKEKGHIPPSEKQVERIKTVTKPPPSDPNEVLFTAKTVWPIDLFPDTLIIQTNSLTFKRGQFFEVDEIETISIKDVLAATVYENPFFSYLDIQVGSAESPKKAAPAEYSFALSKKDAMQAKKIIDSLLLGPIGEAISALKKHGPAG